MVLAGCEPGPPPGTGDPGDARLHLLAADPVFMVLPPEATVVGSLKETPAVWRGSLFEGSGWDGPSVTLTFMTSGSVGDAFGFFARRAVATGWRSSGGVNGLGYVWSWRKTLANQAAATLSLFLDHSQSASLARTYQLVGSAATL